MSEENNNTPSEGAPTAGTVATEAEASPYTPAATPKSGSAVTLWAMIVGIVAIVFAIIPGLSFIAFLPATAAFILGLIGLTTKKPGKGKALAGLILGPVALVVAIIVSVGLIASGLPVSSVADVEPEPAPVEIEEPEEEPEPEPEPEPLPADIVYSGSGDDVLRIDLPGGPDSAAIATIGYTGSSNFAIWALDGNLAQQGLLVNTIGAYNGTVLLDEIGTAALEITASGPWTITLRPLLAAREFEGASAAGSGDDVVIYRGDAGIAAISYTGDSNFAVWSYGNRSDLLVNEIGAYTGNVRWPSGPAVIEISASGAWTIAVE